MTQENLNLDLLYMQLVEWRSEYKGLTAHYKYKTLHGRNLKRKIVVAEIIIHNLNTKQKMSQHRKEVAQNFADRFNGREYGEELTIDDARELMEANCVAIFGASDDLVELRGAIDEELSAYEGLDFLIVQNLRNNNELECIEYTEFNGDSSDHLLVKCTVLAVWCPSGTDLSWKITDNSQQSASFLIKEGSDHFCQALVIAL